MKRLKSRNEINRGKKTFAIVLITIAVIISVSILSFIIYMLDKASFEEIMASFSIFFGFLLVEYFIIRRILKKIK